MTKQLDARISGYTKLAGFFATPAKHTISPAMHNLAFQLTDEDAVYLAFDVDKAGMPKALEAVKSLNMMGVNISMPNKQVAAELVDELSPAARLIGAINTIVNKDGKLLGYNTDGEGFMRSILEKNISPIGKKMTIIGAGGAATAIIVQAALDGVKEIAVLNLQDEFFERIQEKLKQVAEETGCLIQLYDLANEETVHQQIAESAVLVNATGVGMKPMEGQMAIPVSALHSALAVVDIIYSPRQTELLKQAEALGCQTLNGLGMLLYQGAAAFKLWTGKEMPVEPVREMMEQQ